jgi:ABC-type dipeptide/oligopeptide/nickel transport system permease subunit
MTEVAEMNDGDMIKDPASEASAVWEPVDSALAARESADSDLAAEDTAQDGSEEFEVLEEEARALTDDRKRFLKIFFQRKAVVVGFCIFVGMLLLAVFAPLIAPYDPYVQDLANVLKGPSALHLLGTDALGRDLLSRVIYGTRVAFLIGVTCVIVSALIGVTIGLIAGFSKQAVNDVIMRVTDAIMAVPGLILTLLIVGVLGNTTFTIILAVALGMFPGYIRMVNGQVLSVKQNDYVLAELAMGAKHSRIILTHILPNVLSPLIVMMSMMLGGAIMAEAGLSFLGLGLAPPIAAWGQMCFAGQKYLTMLPLMSLAPGFMIMLMVFGVNMVGDGLRDALDPRLRGVLK